MNSAFLLNGPKVQKKYHDTWTYEIFIPPMTIYLYSPQYLDKFYITSLNWLLGLQFVILGQNSRLYLLIPLIILFFNYTRTRRYWIHLPWSMANTLVLSAIVSFPLELPQQLTSPQSYSGYGPLPMVLNMSFLISPHERYQDKGQM